MKEMKTIVAAAVIMISLVLILGFGKNEIVINESENEEELLVLFQEQERLIAKLGSLIKNDRIKEIKERRAEIEKEIIKEIELPVETQHEMQQKIDRLLIYIGELREHNKRLAIKMEIKLKRQENQEYLI